jgi:hypothetical protein
LVLSVAWPPATVVAKRTQQLHGVWDRATKGQTLQGPRVSIRSKATCAAPLCEVLTPCRGRRPHHVQKDRTGSWEVLCLAVSVAREGRSASGRRGVVAGDARTREVGPCHSSCETGEQSGTARCGRVAARGAGAAGQTALSAALPRMTGAPAEEEIDEPTGKFLRPCSDIPHFELLAWLSRAY